MTPTRDLPNEDDLYCSNLPTSPSPDLGKVLVTGASGYVGGLLVRELSCRGYDVRAMVMAAADEYRQVWPGVEVVSADALESRDLIPALAGVSTAYYLIHSMQQRPREYEYRDLRAAENFRRAAESTGVRRIIYLGGLADIRAAHSSPIYRRREVAEALKAGEASVTVLRAPVIIGAGSYSFEILLGLARHLPLVLVPLWARNLCQPIATRDVASYLVGALEVEDTVGADFEIGGASVLTYEQMLMELRRMLGRGTLGLPSPISSVRPYAYLASLLTPVPYASSYSSMQGLEHELVCRDNNIRKLVPIELLTYGESVEQALQRQQRRAVYARWSDSYPPAHELAPRFEEFRRQATFTSGYSLRTGKPAAALFDGIVRLGGKKGWFRGSWMWQARGFVDRLFKGVGTSRGRKQAAELRVNDVIDFWRVEELEPDRRLLLRAEMKVPGNAWLEFRIAEDGEGAGEAAAGLRTLSATAYFDTHSLGGRAYWYLLLPFHSNIFRKLLEDVVAAA